jgi:putative addiction module component (TIGR02574 family)
MSEPARRLLNEAMQLPAQDRAAIAAELLASLDDELDADVEAAWAAEIDRRMLRVSSGEARFEDWDRVREELRPRR